MTTAGGSDITQSPRSVSPFRSKCASEVAQLLREEDLPFQREQVEGKEESYSVFKVDAATPEPLKIYIYEDEAGFFLGERWHIWETPDYDTPQGLMNAFLDGLRSVLAESTVDPPTAV